MTSSRGARFEILLVMWGLSGGSVGRQRCQHMEAAAAAATRPLQESFRFLRKKWASHGLIHDGSWAVFYLGTEEMGGRGRAS